MGRQKKLRLDDAWHWQDEEKEYEHIMTILERQGGFGHDYSDPAFYVRFPTLEEMLRKASAARVNRRLLRYYLIVRLLPNVFALACRS